ncbi:hypothetical protein [Nonomuraea rubra]|uniref:hypothetical protein n=1 Tax=Nonomuraea rubra TaxID=46180 RepID=UPI0031ED9460
MDARGAAWPVAADSHAGHLYGLHGRSWLAEALAWCAARPGLRLPRDPEPYFGRPPPPASPPPTNSPSPTSDALGVAIRQTIATNRRTAPRARHLRACCGTITAPARRLPEAPASCSCTRPAEDAVRADVSCGFWEARACCATPCAQGPGQQRTSRSPRGGGH